MKPNTSKRRPSKRDTARDAARAAGAAPDPDERRHRILAAVDSIPRGRVATYGSVARAAGLPGRARLVGRILAELPPKSAIPWHRVLNAAGAISRPDEAGAALQRRRLEKDGVRFGKSVRAGGSVGREFFVWPDLRA